MTSHIPVSVPYNEKLCDLCGKDKTQDGPYQFVILRAGAVNCCIHCIGYARWLAEQHKAIKEPKTPA